MPRVLRSSSRLRPRGSWCSASRRAASCVASRAASRSRRSRSSAEPRLPGRQRGSPPDSGRLGGCGASGGPGVPGRGPSLRAASRSRASSPSRRARWASCHATSRTIASDSRAAARSASSARRRSAARLASSARARSSVTASRGRGGARLDRFPQRGGLTLGMFQLGIQARLLRAALRTDSAAPSVTPRHRRRPNRLAGPPPSPAGANPGARCRPPDQAATRLRASSRRTPPVGVAPDGVGRVGRRRPH